MDQAPAPVKDRGTPQPFFLAKDSAVRAWKQVNGHWKVFVNDHVVAYLSDKQFRESYVPANQLAAEMYGEQLEPPTERPEPAVSATSD